MAPVGPAPVAPAGPVDPVAPADPVAPVGPLGPDGPVGPAGPLTGPTSIHSTSVQTYRFPSIMYPSPKVLDAGKTEVLARVPNICIEPTLSPPIVEPAGSDNEPSGLPDSREPPKSNVFAEKYAVLNLAVGEPKLYSSFANGIMLVTKKFSCDAIPANTLALVKYRLLEPSMVSSVSTTMTRFTLPV